MVIKNFSASAAAEDRKWVNWQARLCPNTILAATCEGTLLRLDTREDNMHPSSFKCHDFAINTVDTMGDSSILTASDDGSFSLWDLKSMGAQCGDMSLSRGRKWSFSEVAAVASAFFSPHGGSRLLISCNNTVNVYNHGHNLAPFKTYSTCGSGYLKQKDCRQRVYTRRFLFLHSRSF
jgi:WD40 repeat protein